MMATDLRTQITGFDSTTNVTTTGSGPTLQTATGLWYETTGAMSSQWSNTGQEEIHESSLTSRNLSDAVLYGLIKDNLVDTYANQGIQLVIGDGTDLIGYDVAGADAQGIPLENYYFGIKLDVSVIVATPGTAFTAFAGSEANLDQTAITQAGYGGIHLSKASGNSVNCFFDALYFGANDSYHLRINGGTSGTPETTADVVADDVTGGWGIMSNPVGSVFYFFAPTEWGEPTANADVYFNIDGETWLWLGDNGGGRAIDFNHWLFRLVGNATDTIDISWSNLSITSVGVAATFFCGVDGSLNDTNVDNIAFDSVSFTDLSTIGFPPQNANHTFDNITFNTCLAAYPNSCNGTNWIFNDCTSISGAMGLGVAGDCDNLDGVIFNYVSGTPRHAIIITATGTYDFNNFFFNGYGADGSATAAVNNQSGGAVTINVLGGDTPTVLNGTSATTTINNSVTVTVDGVAEGTAIKVIANETAGTVTAGDVLGQGLADNTGTYSFSQNYEGAFGAGLDVLIVARNQGLPNAAIADDGGVLTDETTAANSGTSNDMTLTPASPAVNDAYYWGHSEQFPQMKVNVSTAGSGLTITWEYWNGSTWTALSGVTDGTSSFTTSGLNYVSWTLPGNWATTTVNSQGPYYYVRARLSAVSTPVQATGRWSSLDVTRYLPIPPQGVLQRTITSSGLTVTLSQQEDTISTF